MAAKTFNPKLGIEGGISIIGTSGIVQPFSDQAFVEAIGREIDVAWAVGCRRLVINSGARSESVVRRRFPSLPPQAFVHYGNAIGATLEAAARAGFRQVTMGVMIGKAVKLAEGNLDTHSRNVVMNREFLSRLASEAGCSAGARDVIGRMTLARELWTELSDPDVERFMPALLVECHRHCSRVVPGGELGILLISENGDIRFEI
jgi:cobalt-precorrin-5B (C1)-methyltransferase